jgi:hypothetical protein
MCVISDEKESDRCHGYPITIETYGDRQINMYRSKWTVFTEFRLSLFFILLFGLCTV